MGLMGIIAYLQAMKKEKKTQNSNAKGGGRDLLPLRENGWTGKKAISTQTL